MMADGLSSPLSAQYLLPLRRTSIGSTPPPKEPIKFKDPDASSRPRGLLHRTASAGRGGATPFRRLVDQGCAVLGWTRRVGGAWRLSRRLRRRGPGHAVGNTQVRENVALTVRMTMVAGFAETHEKLRKKDIRDEFSRCAVPQAASGPTCFMSTRAAPGAGTRNCSRHGHPH